MQSRPVICLMGPTASGKTPLAVELVQQLPLEIISVDSAMIYKGMDIGTAKPDAATLQIAPHRLINILDPKEIYSAGDFYKDVQREIEAIFAKGKVPILVGGTMMYFRILQQGIAELPKADANIRQRLQIQAEAEGWPSLHAELQKIDPQAAAKIHANDAQRIQRALEVYMLTGKPISSWQKDETQLSHHYHFLNLGLEIEREVLHQRIEERFHLMLKLGFIDEVATLYARGDLNTELPSIRSVGYRQAWDYLAGKIDQTTMSEQAIAATRQLAKRQTTWLRTWPELINIKQKNEDISFIQDIINNHLQETNDK